MEILIDICIEMNCKTNFINIHNTKYICKIRNNTCFACNLAHYTYILAIIFKKGDVCMKAHKLIKKVEKGKIKPKTEFQIITNGVIDPSKYLRYDIDEYGNAFFLCIEPSLGEYICDSSIIINNEFKVSE